MSKNSWEEVNVEKVKNVLFAFALLLVVSVSLVVISSAAIIYVPDNYSSIQDAVNAASVGDTIIVRSGTYFENVVVNKPLSLIGEGLPTIDAQRRGKAIEITADNCIVKGFRCINAKHPGNAGITVRSDSNIIENNTCEENNYGIYLTGSSNNTISNNKICENCYSGIHFYRSSNNTISNNKIYENCYNGIYLWGESSNNTISNNKICENNNDGIHLSSSNNKITNNTCANNNEGIHLSSSSNNAITKNEVHENYGEGIYLSHSSNNTVTKNEICENNDEGIYLSHSSNNTVTKNEVRENYEEGIYLSHSSNNLIYLNDFVNNTDNIYSSSSDNIWNSTKPLTYLYKGTEYEGYMGNFWSAYDGEDADGNGIGDTPYDIHEPSWGIGEVEDYDNYPLVQSFKNYFE